jgi:hypothetical protein
MSQPSCSQKSNSTIYSDTPTVEDYTSYVYVICNVEKWKILHDQGHKEKELLPAIVYIGTTDEPLERYRKHRTNYNEQTHKVPYNNLYPLKR